MAPGFTSEGELGAVWETHSPTLFALRGGSHSANDFELVLGVLVANATWTARPSGDDLDGEPTGPRRARDGPARLHREAPLANVEGSCRTRKAGSAAQEKDERIAVWERVDDEAPPFSTDGKCARSSEVRPWGESEELAEHDLPVGAGQFQVEGVATAGVVDRLPVAIDQHGSDCARNAGNEIEQDWGERARVVVARVRGSRPRSSLRTTPRRRIHGSELGGGAATVAAVAISASALGLMTTAVWA
jgi:hypothetical protein